MRIAFVGTRGVPASYSGFETFVEELGSRLAERGHEVTTYCRSHHAHERLRTYRGMRLVYVPGIASKHLDTITHSFMSCLHVLFGRYDVVVMCIAGNSPLAVLPRMGGSKVVLTVDGPDWKRRKWGRLARLYMLLSEWLSVRLPNATVTDSDVVRRYYLERFGKETCCISYGGDVPPPQHAGTLTHLGLEPRGYLLLVGRLVPENCAHHLVDAYERLATDLKCVVVGDAPYMDHYIRDLKRRGPHVLLPGYIFGDGYRELMRNAFATVLCSEVGGTHPVLVEAMSAGNCVIVNDTPANLEVIGEAGVSYDGSRGAEGLLDVLRDVIQDGPRIQECRRRAAERARSNYSWETVTDEYEELFGRLVDGAGERAHRRIVGAADRAKQ